MVGVVDSTLKFALSALWNLTDETPSAARNFIECQGLELYEEVLEVEVPCRYTHVHTNTQINSHAVSHMHKHFLSQDVFVLCCSPTSLNPPFSRKFLASWWVQCVCVCVLCLYCCDLLFSIVRRIPASP